MKSSVMHSSVQINDKNIDDIEYLEPYTLYINPYYVVTELQGGDKVSKHYYMKHATGRYRHQHQLPSPGVYGRAAAAECS